jgi:YD repeat-containing protein
MWPALQQGQLQQYKDADGNITTTTYAAAGDLVAPVGRLKSVFRQNAGATASETWNYLYTSTSSTATLAKVQLLRNGSTTPVRQVAYSYYTGASGQPGNSGDLKSVKIEDGSGTVIDEGLPLLDAN